MHARQDSETQRHARRGAKTIILSQQGFLLRWFVESEKWIPRLTCTWPSMWYWQEKTRSKNFVASTKSASHCRVGDWVSAVLILWLCDFIAIFELFYRSENSCSSNWCDQLMLQTACVFAVSNWLHRSEMAKKTLVSTSLKSDKPRSFSIFCRRSLKLTSASCAMRHSDLVTCTSLHQKTQIEIKNSARTQGRF